VRRQKQTYTIIGKVVEQLEEMGKINIDYLNTNLENLITELYIEFAMNTEIQNLKGSQYLVLLDY